MVEYKKQIKNINIALLIVLTLAGVCYGYEVMREVESPAVPFAILRTRFPTAPRTIVYDNSCNLHAYCMNRDPGYFKNSLFVVGPFHWYNHTGTICC